MQRLPKNFQTDPLSVVSMRDVCSMECYLRADESERQVICGANLDVERGDSMAVLGEEPFELQLLMEIIGNIKPYESGRCALVGLGMMRLKRRVLSHVYYVNNQKLLYDHMQGISWLMFASRRTLKSAAERQIRWLKRLLEFDLSRLCFPYIRHLSAAERAVLLLLLTLDIDVSLILADFSQISVEESLFDGIAALFSALAAQGKAVVFATTQPELAERAGTKAAFLIDCALENRGEIADICARFDRRAYQLRYDDPPSAAAARAALLDAFPSLDIRGEAELSLFRGEHGAPDAADVLRAVAGAMPREFIVSKPSLSQAFYAAVEVNI